MRNSKSKTPNNNGFIEEILTRFFELTTREINPPKMTQKNIAYLLNISQQTVSFNLKKLREGRSISTAPYPPQQHPLKKHIKEELERSDAGTNAQDCIDIQRHINSDTSLPLNKSGDRVSRGYIYEVAAKEGYSSKKISRVRKINDDEANAKRKRISKDVVSKFQPDQYKVVTFVDEMKVNANETGKNARGFSRIGHCAYSDKLTKLETINQGVSAIVFVSQHQIEHIHLVQENVTARLFDIAVRECLHKRRNEVEVHILLDNAPIHSDRLLKYTKVEYKNFDFSFLPPNSPDTNAAEFIIKSIRDEINNFLRDTDLVDPVEVWKELKAHIEDFNVSSEECFNACNHAFKVLRALEDHSYPEAKNIVADSKKQRH